MTKPVGNPITDGLDAVERAVDQVTSPDRIMRWITRVVLLIVLIAVGATVTKIAFHMIRKVDQVTTDRDWFVAQHEAVQTSIQEEEAAIKARLRHMEEVEKRSGFFSVSRASDRQETQRLNHAILESQRNRLELTREYNEMAGQITDKTILNGLPRHIGPEARTANQEKQNE